MTCYTKYDIKKVLYSAVGSANFTTAPVLTGMSAIDINKDITVDTKGENITYSILNNIRNTDEINETLRKTGSIKITKNFDTSLLTSHPTLINAGLGRLSSIKKGTVVVTGGKGSSVLPFLTTSTSNISVDNLIYTSEGLKKIESIVSNTSFIIDTPLQTTISTSTTFSNYISCDISDAKGTCDNAFNFVVCLHDDVYLIFKGCNVKCDFNVNFEKQLSITFNITSQDVTEGTYANDNISATFSAIVDETRGLPVKCNFDVCKFQNGTTITSHIPISFELGMTQTEEKLNAIGGVNNVVGFQNRASIKPKMRFARSTEGKLISAYSNISFSAYQENFGIYIQELSFYNVNKTENNNNFDSIMCECNANTLENKRVYLVLPQ